MTYGNIKVLFLNNMTTLFVSMQSVFYVWTWATCPFKLNFQTVGWTFLTVKISTRLQQVSACRKSATHSTTPWNTFHAGAFTFNMYECHIYTFQCHATYCQIFTWIFHLAVWTSFGDASHRPVAEVFFFHTTCMYYLQAVLFHNRHVETRSYNRQVLESRDLLYLMSFS